MSIEIEDEIIRLADRIKSRAFNAAESKWAELPDQEKRRPWPRCKDLTCNRTLICQRPCRGFDY